MAARIRVALEGDDGAIRAAHRLPAGDFAGVDVLELLLGQTGHRVLRVDREHERFPGDGRQLERYPRLPGGLFLLRRQRRAENDVARSFQQILEGSVGGGMGHLLFRLLL